VKNREERVVVPQPRSLGDRRQVRKRRKFLFAFQGRPLGCMLSSAWRAARMRAGLALVRVHDLKHTFAGSGRVLRGSARSAGVWRRPHHHALFRRGIDAADRGSKRDVRAGPALPVDYASRPCPAGVPQNSRTRGGENAGPSARFLESLAGQEDSNLCRAESKSIKLHSDSSRRVHVMAFQRVSYSVGMRCA
jgi:hypothetical protein